MYRRSGGAVGGGGVGRMCIEGASRRISILQFLCTNCPSFVALSCALGLHIIGRVGMDMEVTTASPYTYGNAELSTD